MKKTVISLLACLALASCGKKPGADFSWTPATPKAGETVSFVNQSTDAKKYSWNLGNMKISSEKEPQTVYDQAGNYIVDLTAQNGARSATKTKTITITP